MPVKVLQCLNNLSCDGQKMFAVSILKNADTASFSFDFSAEDTDGAKNYFAEEIVKSGGSVLRYCGNENKKASLFSHAVNLYRIISKGSYAAVHSHIYYFNGFVLFIAWLCRVPVRISHTHTPVSNQKRSLTRDLYKNFMRFMISLFATHRLACSQESGRMLYGKKPFTVINNGIDAERFAFNADTRTNARKDLGLGDSFTSGFIGRFKEQKNPLFLIDVFYELSKRKENSKLLLIGEGPLESAMKEKIKAYGISDKVVFLGLRNDIPELLNAMDVFVLPSLYEGLGIVFIEAQCTGLKCFASDAVPPEAKVTDLEFVPLKESAVQWAERIDAFSTVNKTRADGSSQIKCHGFDIRDTVAALQNIYGGGK